MVLGVLVSGLGVIGMFRFPDVYMQLHASSKAVFLGLVAFLVAASATGDGSIAARAVLVAAFILLTAPVGAHAIARGAYRRREPMASPEAIDESGHRLERAGDG